VAPGDRVDLGVSLEDRYNPLIRRLANFPIPTLCAVNGVAAGARANIALACDIVIAAKSAKFIQPFVNIGLMPDSGGTWVLPRLVGQARALGLALTGQALPAEQAKAWGMIWDVAEDDQLAATAVALAEKLATMPPLAIGRIKRAIRAAWQDEEVGVVVLSGAGDKAFSAGGDQRERGATGYGGGALGMDMHGLHGVIRAIPKPVIAMVSGYAIGGGNVLQVLCDLTIAADNAVFGQTGPRVGSVDPGYGTAYLARIVGEKKAREFWYLCRQYSAAEALAMGLVNAVVPRDQLRAETVGDVVTFVRNRNINYTNVCTFKCRFCAFSKGPLSLNLRGAPYMLGLEEIQRRAVEAVDCGATEVCLQGGIHPDFDGDYYLDVARAVRQAAPSLHLHAFTALEVTEGARRLDMNLREYLLLAKEAGLATLPGTAAEILDDEVRAIICPDKIDTVEWLEAHRTAHSVGLRSNVTIMFGTVERPVHVARHLVRSRALQKETGGFTEFVPLPFVHMATPIFLQGKARRGPTFREVLLMHAVGRIVEISQVAFRGARCATLLLAATPRCGRPRARAFRSSDRSAAGTSWCQRRRRSSHCLPGSTRTSLRWCPIPGRDGRWPARRRPRISCPSHPTR